MHSDVTGIFQYKVIKKLVIDSTLRVFSVKRTHLQSDITYSTQQSQHKACHDSTLRVFSVKNNSFAFWRYGYFSVQSHQKACHWFDVTGFFSKKTLICNLTLHIQHNKVNIKLVTIRRYGFFQKKPLICKLTLHSQHNKVIKKLVMIRRYWVFSVKRTHLQSDTTYSTQQSQQNACHDSTLLGFFSKKNSFAIWHYIFNTTKST